MNINKIIKNIEYYDVISIDPFLCTIEIYTTDSERIFINNEMLYNKFYGKIHESNFNDRFININNRLLVYKNIKLNEYVSSTREVITGKILYDEVIYNHGNKYNRFICLNGYYDYHLGYYAEGELTESYTASNLSIIDNL